MNHSKTEKIKKIRYTRLAAFTLALLIAATGITGCSSKKGEKEATEQNTNASEKNNPQEENADIYILQYKTEIRDTLQKACNTYMSKNPGVTIHLETTGAEESYREITEQKLKNKEEIDIFNIQGPEDCTKYQAQLEDLSQEPWVEEVTENLLSDVTMDKKIYGLPYGIEGYGLIYNKDIFKAAGIDILTLTNYETIDRAFALLQAKIDSGLLKEQFPDLTCVTALAGNEKWIVGTHAVNAVLTNEFENSMEAFQAKTVEFKYADQFQKLIDLQVNYSKYKEHPFWINGVKYQDELKEFSLEKTAVIQQGNWISGELAEINPMILDKLGILPLSLYNINENYIPVGVPMYWCVNNESSDVDKKAAKDFLNWLYQSEEGKSIVVNEFGFIPAFQNYEDYPVQDVLGRAVMNYVNANQITAWVSSAMPDGWSENSVGSSVQKYIAGKMSWKEVIKTAKADWEEARK